MRKRLATLALPALLVSAILAVTPDTSSAALLSFDGKVGKVAVSYMVYNNGSQRFVTEKLSFQDPLRSVSPNSSFTLDEAPPFDVMDGQMLVGAKAWIIFGGTLLEVSKGLTGNVACSGRIILSGGVITGRTPAKASIKLTPMRFQQSVL